MLFFDDIVPEIKYDSDSVILYIITTSWCGVCKNMKEKGEDMLIKNTIEESTLKNKVQVVFLEEVGNKPDSVLVSDEEDTQTPELFQNVINWYPMVVLTKAPSYDPSVHAKPSHSTAVDLTKDNYNYLYTVMDSTINEDDDTMPLGMIIPKGEKYVNAKTIIEWMVEELSTNLIFTIHKPNREKEVNQDYKVVPLPRVGTTFNFSNDSFDESEDE